VTPLRPALGAHLKLESLQRTGSFKLRGAARKLERLSPAERARGVIAASAGNHGLGVACAAQALGLKATIVVPRTAAQVKREGIARYGAVLVVEGAGYDAADATARALAERQGGVFVSPYDDDDVIEGNGVWLGEEIVAQRPSVRCVVAPVGGGGLLSGLGRALSSRGVRVIGVGPRANCAMHASLALGRALTVFSGGDTLCAG
jgi:threonine dehydratase